LAQRQMNCGLRPSQQNGHSDPPNISVHGWFTSREHCDLNANRSKIKCQSTRSRRTGRSLPAYSVATVDTLFRLDDHMRRTDEGFHYGHRRLVARPWPRKV
jgi:hypothetical protein